MKTACSDFFTEHYQMSVLESAPVSSTVGRVFAKDLDEGINAEMKYRIVDGDGADAFDINTDPNFQVGIITVKKVTELLLPSHFRGGFERVCNISKDCYIINSIALNPLINTFLSLKKKTSWTFLAVQWLRLQLTRQGHVPAELLSCAQLFATPADCNPPGSSVHGISPARTLAWDAISFSRGSSQLRDLSTRISCVSCIGRWVLYH